MYGKVIMLACYYEVTCYRLLERHNQKDLFFRTMSTTSTITHYDVREVEVHYEFMDCQSI